ncbi:MAG: hypothetical protein L7F78_12630, partial [Syntrophales bacterium LBB04]|nr:hypothetical protein [Syntrophales bacterium LBB04]
LPGVAKGMRLVSLILIGVISAVAGEMVCGSWKFLPEMPVKAITLALTLLCFTVVRRGISSPWFLYGLTLLCMVFSIYYG